MVNFSSNEQYLIEKSKRTSTRKNSNNTKTYWVLKFKDGYSKRLYIYSLWDCGEEEPKDDKGNLIQADIPYVVSGNVNSSGSNNYLVANKIKVDTKTLHKSNISKKIEDTNKLLEYNISLNDTDSE